jgi:hypothetical protein
MLNPSVSLLPRADLIAQLSQSLGEVKASELVEAVANKLGFSTSHEFSQAEALSILESISSQPGLVGIVARCAKARVILKFNNK